MDVISLIIQLLSGAAGGNVTGALFKKLSLGTVGNSIAGILGGGLGAQLLGPILADILGSPVAKSVASGTLDPATILSEVLSGGAGGGVLMVVVGLIKSMMAKT